LRNAYRITFFDDANPYGMTVFTDLIDRCKLFEDVFITGERPAPDVDNAYLKGRLSVIMEILGIMGITGRDLKKQQIRRVAEALSTVLPIENEEQIKADGGDYENL
jgi:hypothetical protein